ncbi:hypothetical protein MINT15_28710 [Saccharomonospora viridis]|uniref:Uncharacterized protein n=1 Tax=Saccharomonospora viridis TaxID=1852 RepID=A0A837D4D4_9PSEU|nr:hypothetical protein MINT15_28710 [Saccharomonospora viridis]
MRSGNPAVAIPPTKEVSVRPPGRAMSRPDVFSTNPEGNRYPVL